MPGREVDDAQTAHADANPLLNQHSGIVRPAMADGVAHAAEHRPTGLDGPGTLHPGGIDKTRYPAHMVIPQAFVWRISGAARTRRERRRTAGSRSIRFDRARCEAPVPDRPDGSLR